MGSYFISKYLFIGFAPSDKYNDILNKLSSYQYFHFDGVQLFNKCNKLCQSAKKEYKARKKGDGRMGMRPLSRLCHSYFFAQTAHILPIKTILK